MQSPEELALNFQAGFFLRLRHFGDFSSEKLVFSSMKSKGASASITSQACFWTFKEAKSGLFSHFHRANFGMNFMVIPFVEDLA